MPSFLFLYKHTKKQANRGMSHSEPTSINSSQQETREEARSLEMPERLGTGQHEHLSPGSHKT